MNSRIAAVSPASPSTCSTHGHRIDDVERLVGILQRAGILHRKHRVAGGSRRHRLPHQFVFVEIQGGDVGENPQSADSVRQAAVPAPWGCPHQGSSRCHLAVGRSDAGSLLVRNTSIPGSVKELIGCAISKCLLSPQRETVADQVSDAEREAESVVSAFGKVSQCGFTFSVDSKTCAVDTLRTAPPHLHIRCGDSRLTYSSRSCTKAISCPGRQVRHALPSFTGTSNIRAADFLDRTQDRNRRGLPLLLGYLLEHRKK